MGLLRENVTHMSDLKEYLQNLHLLSWKETMHKLTKTVFQTKLGDLDLSRYGSSNYVLAAKTGNHTSLHPFHADQRGI